MAFAALSAGTSAALRFAAAAALAGLVWYALAASDLALAELALLALVFTRVTPIMLGLLQQTQVLANALPAQAAATAMRDALRDAAEPADTGGAGPALARGIEVRIIETLRRLRGRATVVVITHGEALLREADQVLALERGRADLEYNRRKRLRPRPGRDALRSEVAS